MGGHLNWKGEWVPDESPLTRAGEYSMQKELINELLTVTRRYQGKVKDETITGALKKVMKFYTME